MMVKSINLGGAFYGTRNCGIDAEWLQPMWLSSCETTLEVKWLISVNKECIIYRNKNVLRFYNRSKAFYISEQE